MEAKTIKSTLKVTNLEEWTRLGTSDKQADLDKCDVIYFYSQGKKTGTMYQEVFTDPISNKLILANRIGYRESESDSLEHFNSVVEEIRRETKFLEFTGLPFSCGVKVATLRNEFGKEERMCYIDFAVEVDDMPTDEKMFGVLQECICVMNTVFPRFNKLKDNVVIVDMNLKTLLNTLLEDGGEFVSDIQRISTPSYSIDGLVVNKDYQ